MRFLVSAVTERERGNRMIAGISRALSKGFRKAEMVAADEGSWESASRKISPEDFHSGFIFRLFLSNFTFHRKIRDSSESTKKIPLSPLIGKYPFI